MDEFEADAFRFTFCRGFDCATVGIDRADAIKMMRVIFLNNIEAAERCA